MLIAQVFASILATSTPGAIRSRSGMFVAPERRMASWSITKTAAPVVDKGCSFLDTDVTSIFISSSILADATSTDAPGFAEIAIGADSPRTKTKHAPPLRFISFSAVRECPQRVRNDDVYGLTYGSLLSFSAVTRCNSEHGQSLLHDGQMHSAWRAGNSLPFSPVAQSSFRVASVASPAFLCLPRSPRFEPPPLDSRMRFNGVTFVSEETLQTRCSFTSQCERPFRLARSVRRFMELGDGAPQ